MGVTCMCWQSWVNSGDCTEACPGSIDYRNPVAGSEKWRLVCLEMILCFYTFSWAFGVGGDKICFEDEWARTCQACVLLGWWLEWVLHGTAFESALVSYTAAELPILYFSFNNGVNDFLYCRLKKKKKKQVWIAAELLIWVYFCQILILRVSIPGFSSLTDTAAIQTLVCLLQLPIDPRLKGSHWKSLELLLIFFGQSGRENSGVGSFTARLSVSELWDPALETCLSLSTLKGFWWWSGNPSERDGEWHRSSL